MAASFPIEAMSLFGDLPPPKKAKEDDASERSLAITEEKAPTTTELNDSATTVDIPSAWVSSAAHASRRGERDELQDTYILEDRFLDTKVRHEKDQAMSCSLYAVFDGHAGKNAAEYCRARVPEMLKEAFPSDVNDKTLKKALKDVFAKTDKEFLATAISVQPPWKDGCTAAVLLRVDSTLYSANVGDTRTILCKMQDVDGKATVKAIPLTQIHDPTSYEERQRIQTAGGVVTEGRVQGILQVSRSIGDGRFKGVGVVNTPFIIKTSISSSCPFAIVACDGLWDMFSPQDAVDFAHNVLVAQNKPITAEEAEKVARAVCVSLVNEAVKRGSQDNVTVVLIIFNV